jgi:HPt (histidine-containing phosphotransfer) domain-containing protein
MGSEADKLRAELKRYTNLRAWSNDEKAREALSEFIKETEERLRQLEEAAARSD